VIPAAEKVLSSVSGIPKPTFVRLEAGFEHFQKHGVALPPETVQALKEECNGAMFGAVSSPSHKVAGYSSPIVQLRKELDLYANIRPVTSVPGTPGRQVDMTIVRENTECLVCLSLSRHLVHTSALTGALCLSQYVKQETIADTEHGKVAVAKRQISERASRRIGTMAFEVALASAAVREKLPENRRIWKVRSKRLATLWLSGNLKRGVVGRIRADQKSPLSTSLMCSRSPTDSFGRP
jgi:homoisocitrate dehydrogenase